MELALTSMSRIFFHRNDVLDRRTLYDMFPKMRHGKYLPDRSYVVPTQKFLFDNVADAYWNLLVDHGLLEWYQYHDCDNKAMAWKVAADMLFAQYQNAHPRNMIKAEGVACGVCAFKRHDGGGHVINFAVAKCKKEGYRTIYIEPQKQEEILLSQKEVESIKYVYV